MEFTSWDELENSGELLGYEYSWFNDIDYDVATRTPCQNCGGTMTYEGRQDERGTSRRSFAICANCGRVYEF